MRVFAYNSFFKQAIKRLYFHYLITIEYMRDSFILNKLMTSAIKAKWLGKFYFFHINKFIEQKTSTENNYDIN